MKIRLTLLTIALYSSTAFGEVVSVEVLDRQILSGGQSFGPSGAYEKVIGTLHFEIDPKSPANRRVVDLECAPTNESGNVVFQADFYLLKPIDDRVANGTMVIEAPNRGRKGMLSEFNRSAWFEDGLGSEVNTGDEFLLQQGFAMLWVGWQHDTPEGEGLMRAYLPIAQCDDQNMQGPVRSDFWVDRVVFDHSLGDRGHLAYPVAGPQGAGHVLTMRRGATSERTVIDRSLWGFGRWNDGQIEPDDGSVYLTTGFQPGVIYEVVYTARLPRVAGLGMIVLRDAASHFKYRDTTPLLATGTIRHSIGYGLSQSGRLLRQFLYENFNTDEHGRKAFDGLISHTGGSARGSFNQRFAQPSRAIDYSFYYPTDVFPFSDKVQMDPLTGLSDGLQARVAPSVAPKVFYTNSSMEYWIRPTALIHTTPDGSADIDLPENVRIYHFSGTQHIAAPFPPPPAIGELRANPNDYRWFMRSLLLAMQRWVGDGSAPPESRYPTISRGTLIPMEKLRFPDIPGVALPTETPTAFALDWGPRYRDEGIVTVEPPEVGPAYPKLVPSVDDSGNETDGLLSPHVSVPLATYTGWRPINELFVPIENGIYVPFSVSRSDRLTKGDARPSINERYAGRDQYLDQFRAAAKQLVDEGYLREDDLNGLVGEAERLWDYLHSESSSPEGGMDRTDLGVKQNGTP